FGKTNEEFLILNRKFNKDQLEHFQQNFPNIRYFTWEDEFESLVSAMRLEKLAYSFFGFIVIFISAFNLLSIMSMMVMRKIPQLGILMSMGLTSKRISRIFLFQSGLTLIIGSCLGGLFTFIVYHLNERYQIIKSLLSDFPLSNFPLIITWENTIFVLLGAGTIIMIAGFYPALKVSKLNPVDAINYIK
ncbi:MAG: ABC transporter permease, partial [Fidelibacterota bacterium]